MNGYSSHLRTPPSTPSKDRFKKRQVSSSAPSHSTRSKSSSTAKPASLPRILAGAAALTLSKALILDDGDIGGRGDIALLVLGFWASRLGGEVLALARERKGKRRAVDQGSTLSDVRDGMILAGQSVAAFASLGETGPLQTAVFGLAGALCASTNPSDQNSIMSLAPIGIATGTLLVRQIIKTGMAGSSSPLALMGFTYLACQSLFTNGKQRSSSSNLRRTTFSFVSSLIFFAVLWTMGAIPSPLDSPLLTRLTPAAPILLALLCRYIPLPFSTSSTQRLERIRTSREAIAFLGAILALQLFAFPPGPAMLDLLLVLPLSLGSILAHPAYSNSSSKTKRVPSATVTSSYLSNWSIINLLPLRWRSHLQTILHTPASRRMFYFLLLNLGYMGVQMGYGVITNSLGLISDAIHMLFDCLGLGVGLWASVAATWKPDERYTFGYARVETLSGFANGCFLILISIFIIFEAIQRVISPPEMEIKQLLLVSSIGLAINLFGMWATGGHHHHGHGHSHGHGHDHSHHHPIAVHEKKEDHRHDDTTHSHSHSQAHSHSHSHSHSHQTHLRRRSSQLSITSSPHMTNEKTNGHDHHDHSHSHSDSHSHSHSTECDHDHHGHDHGHSHNMRGVFLHVLADTLGSVGVIISTILIKYTGWTGFDPIASLFIAALILASVFPLVIDSGKVLCLDVGEEKETEIRAALSDLAAVEGLANYGAPRFWPRSEGEIVGSIHIRLAVSSSTYDPTRFSTPQPNRGQAIYANSEKVVARVEKVLKSRIKGLTELVIQVEGSEERTYCSCMAGGG